MSRLLVEGSIALAAINVVIAVGVILRRLATRIADRRYAAAIERVRPVVLEWIDGADCALPTDRVERAAFVDLVARYGRALRGEDRDRLAMLAENTDIADALTRRLRHPVPWRRAAAAYRLGDIGIDRCDGLVAALDDRDRRVRNAAARSLGRLGDLRGVVPLVRALALGKVARAVGGQALLDIGSAAAPALADMLGSERAEERMVAAELLGRLESGGVSALIATLADPDPEVRVATVRALGRLGSRTAADAVPLLLTDPVGYVRAAAASAVAQLGGYDQLPRLEGMARLDDHLPARAAAQAIAVLDPTGLAARADRSDTPPHLLEAADLLRAR